MFSPGKQRGFGIAVNAIQGDGCTDNFALNINGCTVKGVSYNGIQLYGTSGTINVEDTHIESWGMNSLNEPAKNFTAIRGSAGNNDSRIVTFENISFGLDEGINERPHNFVHVNLNGDSSLNSTGSRPKGTYYNN